MGALTPMHLILILAVALLVIGPGKLPETGAALGKAIRQFKDAADGITQDAAGPATQADATPATQLGATPAMAAERAVPEDDGAA